jgi:hypothetical protein
MKPATLASVILLLVKQIYSKDQRLESHRLFPYIGWAVVILLALFVYDVTMELKDTTDKLQSKVDTLEKKVNSPVDEISDFEN